MHWIDNGIAIREESTADMKMLFTRDLHLFGLVHTAFGVKGKCVNGSYSPIVRKMIGIEKVSKGFVVKSIEQHGWAHDASV